MTSTTNTPAAQKDGANMGQKEPEHTPGPWRIWDNPHGGATIETGHVSIADVKSRGGVPAPTQEHCLANARLIAAAPDLLEALRQILAADMQGVLLPSRLSELAAAAVKKARGGK